VTGASVIVECDRERVRSVQIDGIRSHPDLHGSPPAAALVRLASAWPDASVGWYDRRGRGLLTDPATWGLRLHTTNEVRSAALLHRHDPALATLGAADFDSALIHPAPADRPFGTWVLSPVAGVAHARVLNAAGLPPLGLPFGAWLLLFGRRAMAAGAVLWSDPGLLTPAGREADVRIHTLASAAAVVRLAFGAQFLLPWLGVARPWGPAAAAALAAAARPAVTSVPAVLPWDAEISPAETAMAGKVEVVIPTLDRRDLLMDTLGDLAVQTVPVGKVVVVEQTTGRQEPLPMVDAGWPFPLEHVVIQRMGAGNARNVGLSRSTAPWVLLLDDDVRFAPDMVARLLAQARASGSEAVTARLENVRPGAEVQLAPPAPSTGPRLQMWPGFGSGGALVARHLIDEVGGFDRRIDGGFGEDTELGVRLRQVGAMVLVAVDPPIAHLKAPTGGMRAVFPHPWQGDPVRPRPSPTMLLARRSFETAAMATGYRIHWWLESARRDGLRVRPWKMQAQWKAAVRWRDHLERSEPPEEARSVPPLGAASSTRPEAASHR
jgi:hypothetical protein